MPAVRVRSKGAVFIPLSELHGIQGKTLKEMTTERAAKLERSLLKDGIDFTLTVWRGRRGKDKEDRWWIVDGHGRDNVLRQLEQRGYEIPPVPCSITEADSFAEARRKVLRSSSTFHRLTRQGVYEFLNEENLPLDAVEDFELSDFDSKRFRAEFGEAERAEGDAGRELGAGDFESFKHRCPRCGFEFDDSKPAASRDGSVDAG